MDFSLTEEQTMFRDLFRDFAEKEVAKIAEHVDRSEEPPLDLYKNIPEAYGGVGIDWLSYTLLAEELGKHCLSTAVTIAIHTSLAAMSILDVGTEEQKQKHLPAMAAGEVIGAFALTEPDAGSDPGSLTTRADKVEGGYRLNGTKNWVSNAGLGGVMVVFASTHPGARHKGISAFVVANDAPGVMIGYREKTLGLRGMDIRTVYLEDCFVPEANRLNGENEGWAIVVRAFDRVRLTLAAVALGAAQTALALGVTFAAERKQFGVQIARCAMLRGWQAAVRNLAGPRRWPSTSAGAWPKMPPIKCCKCTAATASRMNTPSRDTTATCAPCACSAARTKFSDTSSRGRRSRKRDSASSHDSG
ncbi:MAG: acyl-CoA dehydrogenase family protein [Chloroflexi bacterium]|nr:acyl-CoA dehydrogenase family protein [Chloroflexota bacterium]